MRGLFLRLRREELGATTVVVVLLMTALMIAAALVVDVGAMQARKAQLQDAADAAAIAIAQECLVHAGTSRAGCAASVVSGADATASELAIANLNDGEALVDSVEFPTPDTVRVTLSSVQPGYFGIFAGVEETDLRAAATARFLDVAPLSLAMASCAFPAPGEETVVQAGLAVPTILSGAIGDSCGIVDPVSTYTQLGIEPVTGLLAGILAALLPTVPNLNGTTGLVAGGWLADGSCTYDPNLLTTVSATISKLIPPSCATAVRDWGVSSGSPQRVLLPVFDNGLDQLVLDDVLSVGDVDRYAVVDVTGYSFSGLLGLGTVAGSDPSLCRSGDGALGDALIDTLAGLTDDLRSWLFDTQGGTGSLLNDITGCQALEGTFVGFVDSEAAARLLTGVELVE